MVFSNSQPDVFAAFNPEIKLQGLCDYSWMYVGASRASRFQPSEAKN
jgi:hypothetical protein